VAGNSSKSRTIHPEPIAVSLRPLAPPPWVFMLGLEPPIFIQARNTGSPLDGGDQGLFTLPYIDAEVWIEFEGGGLE
jgi:hypothetical protein